MQQNLHPMHTSSESHIWTPGDSEICNDKIHLPMRSFNTAFVELMDVETNPVEFAAGLLTFSQSSDP